MLSAAAITALHDRLTTQWHEERDGLPAPEDAFIDGGMAAFLAAVHSQHQANFELWHLEDQAREPQATDQKIASVKRKIDQVNQRRNDLAEQCDSLLLGFLSARDLPAPLAELHSETPGMIIDRLSILALKLYHTREEIDRAGAPPGHAQRNRERLRILEEQRSDLALCLDRLWQQVLGGERRFKQYRQLKMYNDPALNPAVYGSGG